MVIDGLRENLKMECVDLCFFYMAFTVLHGFSSWTFPGLRWCEHPF